MKPTRAPSVIGRLKPGSTHFHVEELPAYSPCGEGEHLYVQLEKRGHNTQHVADALARACGVSPRAVGYAGRKDRHAVTSQWFSVHFGDPAGLEHLDLPDCTVLALSRHRNKLKPGHLRGNRFALALELDDPQALRDGLERLTRSGVPNTFGPQRFGHAGANLAVARALGAGDPATAIAHALAPRGDWHPRDGLAPLASRRLRGAHLRIATQLRKRPEDPGSAWRAGGAGFHRLIVSAAQSAVFNAVYAARAADGLLHTPQPGDIARTRDGGFFHCPSDELDALARRAGALEILLTGPMPGHHRFQPESPMREREAQWAAASGIDPAWFDKGAPLAAPGERRPLVNVFLEPPRWDDSWLRFALAPGAYATTVLTALEVALPERRDRPEAKDRPAAADR
ncbi:MAG: tRNA pseudouridine(13) synthase TruD [Planctomycetota bacterium]